jgi:hypothetical protein
MGQPRFVPITVTVDAGQATPKVTGLKNAFDDLDKTADKAARGGLKNAFDGSSTLRSEMAALGSQIPIVGRFFSGATSDLLRYFNATQKVSQGNGLLKSAFGVFQGAISSAARGKNSDVELLLKDIGVDVGKSLSNATPAFKTFLDHLKQIPDAEDRAAFASNIFGNQTAKLLPTLEAAAAGEAGVAAETAGVGTSMLAALGPIALVVAIVAALTAGMFVGVKAVTSLGEEVFSLAMQASDAGSKIYDLQQKTNFSAETLSALSVAAASSGSSIEGISASLAIFDKNIALANESDTKLAKQFKDFNVDISNNERALRSIFRALIALPDGAKQTELAMLAFGRSGRDVLGIVKETNGDLDKAIQKYGALGLILSGDATRGADKFGDQLALVNLQIDMVKVRLGTQFMPVVASVLTKVSDFLTKNSGEWVKWAGDATKAAEEVESALNTIRITTEPLIGTNISFGESLKAAWNVSFLGESINVLREYDRLTKNLLGNNNGIPAAQVPDIAPVPLRKGGFTEEQIDKFTKELTPFQQRAEAAAAAVQTFGEQSHFAAEMQYQLKHPVSELSAEVQDQAKKFNALALAQARQLDGMVAAKKANEDAAKQAEKVTQANENLRNEIDAIRLRTTQMGEAEGRTRTELEKFNEALIRRKDQDLLDPKLINQARDAYKGLDAALAQIARNKAFDKLNQDRQAVANSIQSISESVGQSAAGALTDSQQRLQERHAILQQTAKSIEGIASLKIDRNQFAGLVDLFKSGPQVVDLAGAYERLQKQLDPKVLENLAPKDLAQIIALLFQAAEADRQLADAQTPLAQATRQYGEELKRLQNEVPIAAKTAALRYQIAWQDASNAVVLANDSAIIKLIHNQVYLAHQMDVDFNRLNDGVVDFLAHQKTLQQTFQDVRTNTVRTFFDGIDSAIDRMTKRLGVAGTVLGTFLKDLAHLAASKFLQRLLGLGTGEAQTAGGGGGGGGGILNVLGGLFRPQGGGGGSFATSGLTGGFAGGPGGGGFFGGGNITNGQTASASALAGIFGGGGITAPPSLSGSPGSLAQLFSGGVASGVGAGGSSASAGGLGSLLGPGTAALLPFLGAGLGASLGKGSTLATLLGGVGGGLLGLVGIAALPTSLGGLGAGIAGLSALGLAAAGIGAAAVVAAIIIAKNKARQRDEKTRNEISNNTGAEIWKLIGEARSLGTSASMARWTEIANNYQTQIAQIKDGKTKRNAQLQWTNDFLPLLQIVKTRAAEGDKAKAFSSAFVPTFAHGGMVPFRSGFGGGLQTLIKVRPGELMIPPGGGMGMNVPGVDRGYDSVYTTAPPGTRVLTKPQQAKIRGFATGGVVGGGSAPTIGGNGGRGGGDGSTTVQIPIYLDAGGVVARGVQTSEGSKAVVGAMHQDAKTNGRDGYVGTVEVVLTRRN